MLGESYVQVSREGLGFQKSQNGGTNIPALGEFMSPYYRWASEGNSPEQEKSFFDGIDTSLAGIATLAKGGDEGFLRKGVKDISQDVDEAVQHFSATAPEKIAPPLAAGLKATNALLEQAASSNLSEEGKYDISYELRVKQDQFNNALIHALGLCLRANLAPEKEPEGRFAAFRGATESFQVAIPGQKFWVKVHIVTPSATAVGVGQVSLSAPEGENWSVEGRLSSAPPLAGNKSIDQRFTVRVPDNAALSTDTASKSSYPSG
jgi:hypothetical protein